MPAVFNVAPGDTVGLINDIAAANGNGQASNTIVLAASSVYALTQNSVTQSNNAPGFGLDGLPTISSNLTIQGNDATIERGALQASFRLLDVSGGSDVTLENLTLEGGLTQGGAGGAGYYGGGGGAGLGGAIFNQGALTLIDVTLTGNAAQGGDGGAVSVTGPVSGSAGGMDQADSNGSGGFGSGGAGGKVGDGGFGGGAGGGSPAGVPGFAGGTAPSGYWDQLDNISEQTGDAGAFAAIPVDSGGGGAGLGGAIFNDAGTLTVIGSAFTGNDAQGGPSSGADATDGGALGGALQPQRHRQSVQRRVRQQPGRQRQQVHHGHRRLQPQSLQRRPPVRRQSERHAQRDAHHPGERRRRWRQPGQRPGRPSSRIQYRND